MTVSTATLQTEVIKILGYNSSDTVLLARALAWLNEAMDDILFYIPEAEFYQKSYMTIATVADQAAYPMPSDFLSLLSIVDVTNQNPLNVLPREEWDRRHPDPSDEETDAPADVTYEYDRTNLRNVIRLAPTPDDAYTLRANMRCWHSELSGSQDVLWDKIENVVKRRAAYFGSIELFNSPEDIQFRNEMNQLSMVKMDGLRRVLASQKPRPNQIPAILKKSDY